MQTPPPTLAHIWQTLRRRKWKVVGVWAWRTLGCLCSDLHQISRGYQQMAGVRWGWGGGHEVVKKCEIKMWDGRQGYEELLLIKTHTWHTHSNTLSSYVLDVFAQPSWRPSAHMWFNLSGGDQTLVSILEMRARCWLHTVVAFGGPTHNIGETVILNLQGSLT